MKFNKKEKKKGPGGLTQGQNVHCGALMGPSGPHDRDQTWDWAQIIFGLMRLDRVWSVCNTCAMYEKITNIAHLYDC